jgi:hypothetical protein
MGMPVAAKGQATFPMPICDLARARGAAPPSRSW